MSRPAGIIKRPPQLFEPESRKYYTKISKADLMDAYRNLYQQVFSEQVSEDEVMRDLEKRLLILKNYR